MNVVLSTQTKLKIARLIYRGVKLFSGTGDTNQVECRRGGLNWKLDLSQGIDLSIYVLGAFEPKTSRALRSRIQPGMTVLDIGANVGAHAVPMASWVGPQGKVYAFEPTEWAFNRLSQNRQLNPQLHGSLNLVHAALVAPGASTGKQSFYSSWSVGDVPNGNGATHPVHGGNLQSTGNAKFVTLDDWVEQTGLSRIDLIKMDIDGHEVQALQGAARSLERFHPPILMELAPTALAETGTSAIELITLLKQHGYEFWDERGKRRLPSDPAQLAAMPAQGGSINILAKVPA